MVNYSPFILKPNFPKDDFNKKQNNKSRNVVIPFLSFHPCFLMKDVMKDKFKIKLKIGYFSSLRS